MQIRLRAPVIAADGNQVGRVERLLVAHATLVIQEVVMSKRLPTTTGQRIPIVSHVDDAEGLRLTLATAAY